MMEQTGNWQAAAGTPYPPNAAGAALGNYGNNAYANQNLNANMNYPGNYPRTQGDLLAQAPPMYRQMATEQPMTSGVYPNKQQGTGQFMQVIMDSRSPNGNFSSNVFPEHSIPANAATMQPMPAQAMHMHNLPANGMPPQRPGQPQQASQYPVQNPMTIATQYYETVPKYIDEMPMDGVPQRGNAPAAMRYMPQTAGPNGQRARPYTMPNGVQGNARSMAQKKMISGGQNGYPTVPGGQPMMQQYNNEPISPAPYNPPVPNGLPAQSQAQFLQYQQKSLPPSAYPPGSIPVSPSMRRPGIPPDYPQQQQVSLMQNPHFNPQFAGSAPSNMMMTTRPTQPQSATMYSVPQPSIAPSDQFVMGPGGVPQRYGNAVANGPLEIKQIPNPMAGANRVQMHEYATRPPFVPPIDGEPCMTLPTPQEPVLPPFKLEHGLTMSHHYFTLRTEVYNQLINAPELELELRCYHHDDPSRSTNWPEAISVAVNNHPVHIQRGPNIHRALFIKQLCQPAKRNTITISASACCCSHFFLLHVVHRPTVRSVIQHVLKKQTIPTASSIEKIKRSLMGSGNRGFSAPEEIEIPLRCPLSRQRIVIPARSNLCQHLDCFDLQAFLLTNSERNIFKCALCGCHATIEHLEVDEFFLSVLKHLTSDPNNQHINSILVDGNGSWKVNMPKMKIEEAPRYNPVSPSTTISSWDHNSPAAAVPLHGPPSFPELPRSLSVGRSTPKGPGSVGPCGPAGTFTPGNGEFDSPGSTMATVPVSPPSGGHGTKNTSFPGSISSCPQKSPTPSIGAADSRTPVPQMQSVHSAGSNGSLPSTPRTPGSQPPSNNPPDFFDLNFEGEGDTDNEALQFLSDIDLLSFFDPATSQSGQTLPSGSSFPNSAGANSDSGISIISTSSSTPNHPNNSSLTDDLLGILDAKPDL